LISAGALPQTPLGELAVLPQLLQLKSKGPSFNTKEKTGKRKRRKKDRKK